MSLRVQNNLEALTAHSALQRTSDATAKSMQRLSTGYRINSGADDAAGLGISEKMRGQIRGLAQAQRNIGDGTSLIQTAEGSLDEVHSMLQRVRELAVQYNNSTNSAANKSAIQSEVYQLASEIERIGTSAKFNGISLLNTGTNTVTFQVGANDGESITVDLVSLGEQVGTDYYDLSSSTALSNIDASIDAVSSTRATFGAVQNRLEHAGNAAAAYAENLTAAESRIRDVDMADEMVTYSKNQILQQAGTSMLSQANSASQNVLSLLR
jgi:flagellin